MFTGLVEQQGRVLDNIPTQHGNRLIISADFKVLKIGESIAVNGTCLTLLSQDDSNLAFDLSPETLQLTTLGSMKPNETVNLERAMMASNRFGGHYVSGHVDARAMVHAVHVQGEYLEIELSGFDRESMYYLIPKGSITLDGVSLTINAVVEQTIKIMLVPHTLSHTTLGSLKVGQGVNIEFDYIARILAHQFQCYNQIQHEVQKCPQ
ncbi:MAG: riboflavin synthase [Legionella sp.]|nr:riboflavin synthase [Legionella sp.]